MGITTCVGGKVVEVGKMPCFPAGSNGNEVVLEAGPDQVIRVQGISDSVTRWLGANLFKNVLLTFDIAE